MLLSDVALVLGISLISLAVNALVKVVAAHTRNEAFQSFAALT
jgi:hypothetical protein